jgi:hypothetical protein
MRLSMLLALLLLSRSVSLAQEVALPKLCKPCLFYGGDVGPNDPNANAFWNENTLRDNDTQTFGELTVPKGRAILIQGILFQTLFLFTDKLDPAQVTWEIRTGNISDNGGTLVARGSGTVATQPTGRLYNGGTEYTLAVKVNPAVQLTGGQSDHGTQYWFNLTPQCTNQEDPDCVSAVYYVSNTTTEINSYRGNGQRGLPIINSPMRGYQWEYVCKLGFVGCERLSFGLMGKVLQ